MAKNHSDLLAAGIMGKTVEDIRIKCHAKPLCPPVLTQETEGKFYVTDEEIQRCVQATNAASISQIHLFAAMSAPRLPNHQSSDAPSVSRQVCTQQ